MKTVIRMRAGAALALATLIALVGAGPTTDRTAGTRERGAVVRSGHPDASRPPKAGTKSTFSVDGVPLIVDEETVIYA